MRHSRMSGWMPISRSSLHGVLRRLGLQLARRRDVRHQRHVDEERVLRPGSSSIWRIASRNGSDSMSPTVPPISTIATSACRPAPRAALDELLDLVGDVRDDLHRLAEVLAAALLRDDRLVDAAGREVVHLPHLGGGEALVVAEVEVGLRAVVGHEHLAVLERAHRARIDVDVRVELEERDFEAARFEQRGDGRGGEPLAERRHDAAGHEHVFRHRFRTASFA